MKRTIELSANMNADGYGICVTVNGRRFEEHNRKAGNATQIVRSLYAQLKAVYGDRKLFEQYIEYQDILGAMRAAGKIAGELEWLHSRLVTKEEA